MSRFPRARSSPGEPRSHIDAIADDLLDSYLDPEAKELQHIGSYDLPSEQGVEEIVELSRFLLFPGYAGPDAGIHGKPSKTELRYLVRTRLAELRGVLHRQLYRALHHKQQLQLGKSELQSVECAEHADEITDRFLGKLVDLRETVRLDLRAAFEGDPAASGLDEILLCYPGMHAVTVYRIAHLLLREGAVVIPRMMTELAHRRTGIDIHPGADIGKSFFIDHGTGVVIGETTLIGDHVRVYQGVTLGALTVPQGEARPEPGHRRHPTLEDDVVIYANATILGGSTVIGRGAVVGGNAFVTSSVPPGGKVPGSSRTSRPSITP